MPAADGEAAEADTVAALLQRVLHPRLRAMLGESNLAVRQVRQSMRLCVGTRKHHPSCSSHAVHEPAADAPPRRKTDRCIC